MNLKVFQFLKNENEFKTFEFWRTKFNYATRQPMGETADIARHTTVHLIELAVVAVVVNYWLSYWLASAERCREERARMAGGLCRRQCRAIMSDFNIKFIS